MKTAKQILIENDCYQDGIRYSLQGRIISTDVGRFEKAMKSYAELVLNEVSEKIESIDSFEPISEAREIIKTIKNQLK